MEIVEDLPGVTSVLVPVSGGGSPGNNLELASIGSIGFWLKTTTPDLQVAIALDDPTERGLMAVHSYFDRRPYVEYDPAGVPTYVEQHRTLAGVGNGPDGPRLP
jgi:hypothetical protein